MKLSRRNLLKIGGSALATLLPLSANAEKLPNVATSSPLGVRKMADLSVSALGLGCQSLGQDMYGVAQPTRQQAVNVVRKAVDFGVTLFDTAEAYGPFESELVLGEGLKGVRDRVKIASKFGWDIDPKTGKRTGKLNSRSEHIKQVVDAMLQRLQTDHIDLLYQHRLDPAVPIEEVAGAVGDLIKAGKVLHWGLCEVGEKTIRTAHAIQPLTAIQSEYSLFFRNRERDVIPLCEELGIGFVPWSPLAMGVLAGYVKADTKFNADPSKDFRSLVPAFSTKAMQHNIQLVELVKRWAEQKQCTPAQLSLAWLLAQKAFIVPIVGTSKIYHLLENLGASGLVLDKNEWAQFQREVNEIHIIGERLPQPLLSLSEVE